MLRALEVAEPDVGDPAGPRIEDAARLELPPDPRPDRAVGQALLRRPGTALLDPGRDRDQEAGGGPLVRIGVECHVEALGAGVVDEREHLVRAAGERRAMVEVGDVDRRLAPPADLDRLAERIEEPVAERVAHVGVVDPAQASRLVREDGQLVRRGE
ncbi:MAG: hypothetical protein C0498_11470 [Anaerolinea sp.]|nr:hypothetical protein [Anaerolinea sp.]